MRQQNIPDKTSFFSKHANGLALDIVSSLSTENLMVGMLNIKSYTPSSTEEKIEKLKHLFKLKSSMALEEIDAIVRKYVFSNESIKNIFVTPWEKQKQSILNMYVAQNKMHIVEFEFSIRKNESIKQIMSVYVSPFRDIPGGETLDSDYKFELCATSYWLGDDIFDYEPSIMSVTIDEGELLTKEKVEALVEAKLREIFNSFETILQP